MKAKYQDLESESIEVEVTADTVKIVDFYVKPTIITTTSLDVDTTDPTDQTPIHNGAVSIDSMLKQACDAIPFCGSMFG